MSDRELLEELKKIDTPTITNVVATYPGQDLCLSIYNPWTENWYTDNRLSCWYPELGPIAGYAVTATYALPDPNYRGRDFMDVLAAMDANAGPSIFCGEQKFPAAIADKVGLAGGVMTSAMRAVGAIGAVMNGPSRDIHEIRPMGFQYLVRGICAGHGAQAVQAVQVPVSIAGMDVAPGEIVHMDENGAVKFPAARLEEVVTNAKALGAREEEKVNAQLAAKGLEELRPIWAGQPYAKKD
jgi:4-hydroxy-4-methyl-2-oxoglutarate aldolase